jgi:hypothetical protein
MSSDALYGRLSRVHDRANQHRLLARLLDARWDANQQAIKRMDRRLRLAAGSLAIQIVLCALAVASTVP